MKPWLWLPPKLAHDLSPIAIDLYSLFFNSQTPEWRSFKWNNLHFNNPLGLAGGVDKNAEHLPAWQKLGCGFVELGTVTPEAQEPNTGIIFDRSLPDHALWNKMGFPSHGSDEFFYNLKKHHDHSKIPVFINIGKNRTTPNEAAADDYIYLIDKLNSVADAFVLNISSPNTQGLRNLANKDILHQFLQPICRAQKNLNIKKPLLVKLSPDHEKTELKIILDTCLQNDVDGFILTNTTLSRNTEKVFSNEGGISGKPLAELSKSALRTTIDHLGVEKAKKLVVSVGGVMTSDDVFERLSMGADLVEVYTALIFSGLNFFRKVAKSVNEHDKK